MAPRLRSVVFRFCFESGEGSGPEGPARLGGQGVRSGLGGEEVFCGHGSFKWIGWLKRVQALLSFTKLPLRLLQGQPAKQDAILSPISYLLSPVFPQDVLAQKYGRTDMAELCL